jgi:bifunctional enzyme CysN/CysC
MSNENPLKTVMVGHVDHGKSTLVGRLLYETDSLEEGQYEKVQQTCEKRGVPFEWAFLLDALQAERNQNVTIDTAQIWFESELRPYCIIDAPGHKEFLKNMVTGAASAEAALLLIAADEGVQEQSRRHGYMLSMLGIDQVSVVINKMDIPDYSEERFEEIVDEYTEFLDGIGIEPRNFVPTSAREGDNVVDAPTENMPWWEGETVLEELDRFDRPEQVEDRPLRFPIQDIYRFDNRRILAGRVESGTLEQGQELVFTPHQKTAKVETIEEWSAPTPESVQAGKSTGITLSREIFVERGHVASTPEHTPTQSTRFHANLFWLGTEDLQIGEPYKLKMSTINEECTVTELNRIMDGANLEPLDTNRDHIERYDVADVVIETRRPVALDRQNDHPTMGRFVIVDGYDVAGGGIITEIEEVEQREDDSLRRVEPGERASRRGHRGALLEVRAPESVRFAVELERRFFKRGLDAYFVDDVFLGTDRNEFGRYLTRLGIVAIVARDTKEERSLELDVAGGEANSFEPELLEQPALAVEKLLPQIRTGRVEARMPAEAE